MMNNYPKLTKGKADQWFQQIEELSELDYQFLIDKWSRYELTDCPQEFISLRDKVLLIVQDLECHCDNWENKDREKYFLDLKIGLLLYREFNPQNGFIPSIASDDDFWRFLACNVFPDITNKRYPKKDSKTRLNADRLYADPRRIWVKILWWYVHLSWQGSEESTFEALKSLGSNAISQLYERPGSGFQLDLTREIVRIYATVPIQKRRDSLFSELQKINLVESVSVEPKLTEGGERGYVLRLLRSLGVDLNEGN